MKTNLYFTKKIMIILAIPGILLFGIFELNNTNNNKNVNNLILNSKTVSSTSKVDNNEQITQLSMGVFYSSALTNKGNIYTWGLNDYGQLGNGTNTNWGTPGKITDNFKLSEGEHITQLSMGKNHSSALTNKGNVYTWGNNDYGKLGNGSEDSEQKPTKITDKFSLDNNSSEQIIQLNMGPTHSAALTNQGNVYTWGDNSFGNLGDGSTEHKYTPTKITDNFNNLSVGEKITQLNMGYHFSSALSNQGNVYTWGSNSYGELGDGTKKYTFKPKKITDKFNLNENEQIIKVNLGFFHSSALTNQGNVYTWGNNSDGELGNGTNDNKNIPTNITTKFGLDLDNSEQITQLNMGGVHSSALSNQGNVYTWGDNHNGELGNGTNDIKDTPTKITTKFGLDLDNSEQITQLELGRNHSSAISNQGNVYTWGSNDSGQLGHHRQNKIPGKVYFSNYISNKTVMNISPNSAIIDFNLTIFINKPFARVTIWNNNQQLISKPYTSSGNYTIELDGLQSNKEYNLSLSVDEGPKQSIKSFKTLKYTSNYIEQKIEIKINDKMNIKNSDKKITLTYLQDSQAALSGTGYHKITYKNGKEQKTPILASYYFNNSIQETYILDQSIENIETINTFYDIDGYQLLLDSYSGPKNEILEHLNSKGLSAGAITGIVLGSIFGVILLVLLIYYLSKNDKIKNKINELKSNKRK